jgi:hypothetical protein
VKRDWRSLDWRSPRVLLLAALMLLPEIVLGLVALAAFLSRG